MFKKAFIAALVATSSPAMATNDATKAINYKVKVDGKSFRVRVQGDQVKAIPKGMIAGQSISQRDTLRAAVFVATGCQIVDDYWDESRLAGKLACSAPGTPLPPAAEL